MASKANLGSWKGIVKPSDRAFHKASPPSEVPSCWTLYPGFPRVTRGYIMPSPPGTPERTGPLPGKARASTITSTPYDEIPPWERRSVTLHWSAARQCGPFFPKTPVVAGFADPATGLIVRFSILRISRMDSRGLAGQRGGPPRRMRTPATTMETCGRPDGPPRRMRTPATTRGPGRMGPSRILLVSPL